MEGTEPNAATRKRRSSILKSQRPPRTPFSELEFNVATPTDSSKSRRVSFSRKTGVVEFATNEATTTWKNFYEEPNKSLDSSGHTQGAQSARPSIGHLGNRIFEQQFQEFEADIDFGGTIGMPHTTIDNSLNVNLTEQIALLECTANDKKLTAPQSNLEMSLFTENQSRLYKDDLTNPLGNEMSDRININFSAVQNIGQGGGDDLDDIVRDLESSNANTNICGPFRMQEVSQYIEINLNMTQGVGVGNTSDMSITDTILSPKKDLSKSSLVVNEANKSKPWVEDKENIIVNPYVTPAEADNFAINEESEKVLVFDGKKLKYADINADIDDIVEPEKKCMRTDLHVTTNNSVHTSFNMSMTTALNPVVKEAKRQTIVFANDENADISITQCVPNSLVKSIANSTRGGVCDMSVTQAVSSDILARKQNMDDSLPDMSFTKVAPILDVINSEIAEKSNTEKTKRQTILFNTSENLGNISMTQCIPNNIVQQISSRFNNMTSNGDMSMTQAVSKDILIENIKTANESLPDMSFTKVAPVADLINIENKLKEDKSKRQTIVFNTDDDQANISMTQCIPNNIVQKVSAKFDSDVSSANMSITQAALPVEMVEKLKEEELTNNIETNKEKRQTIVFQDADLSLTRAIPTNIKEELQKSLFQSFPVNKDVEKEVLTKRNTIFTDGDMSITGILDEVMADLIPRKSTFVATDKDEMKKSLTRSIFESKDEENKHKNTENSLFKNDDFKTNKTADNLLHEAHTLKHSELIRVETELSKTKLNITANKSINVSVVKETKRQTIVFSKDDDADISVTQCVPVTIETKPNLKHEMSDVSTTLPLANKTLPSLNIEETKTEGQIETEMSNALKRKTIVFEDADLSITRAIPNTIKEDLHSLAKSMIEENSVKQTDKDHRQTILASEDMSISGILDEVMSDLVPRKSVIFGQPVEKRLDNISTSEVKPENNETKEPQQAKVDKSVALGEQEKKAFNIENETEIDKEDQYILNSGSEENLADISFTKCVPESIRNNLSMDIDDVEAIEMIASQDQPNKTATQQLNSTNHLPSEKRQTLVQDSNSTISQEKLQKSLHAESYAQEIAEQSNQKNENIMLGNDEEPLVQGAIEAKTNDIIPQRNVHEIYNVDLEESNKTNLNNTVNTTHNASNVKDLEPTENNEVLTELEAINASTKLNISTFEKQSENVENVLQMDEMELSRPNNTTIGAAVNKTYNKDVLETIDQIETDMDITRNEIVNVSLADKKQNANEKTYLEQSMTNKANKTVDKSDINMVANNTYNKSVAIDTDISLEANDIEMEGLKDTESTNNDKEKNVINKTHTLNADTDLCIKENVHKTYNKSVIFELEPVNDIDYTENKSEPDNVQINVSNRNKTICVDENDELELHEISKPILNVTTNKTFNKSIAVSSKSDEEEEMQVIDNAEQDFIKPHNDLAELQSPVASSKSILDKTSSKTQNKSVVVDLDMSIENFADIAQDKHNNEPDNVVTTEKQTENKFKEHQQTEINERNLSTTHKIHKSDEDTQAKDTARISSVFTEPEVTKLNRTSNKSVNLSMPVVREMKTIDLTIDDDIELSVRRSKDTDHISENVSDQNHHLNASVAIVDTDEIVEAKPAEHSTSIAPKSKENEDEITELDEENNKTHKDIDIAVDKDVSMLENDDLEMRELNKQNVIEEFEEPQDISIVEDVVNEIKNDEIRKEKVTKSPIKKVENKVNIGKEVNMNQMVGEKSLPNICKSNLDCSSPLDVTNDEEVSQILLRTYKPNSIISLVAPFAPHILKLAAPDSNDVAIRWAMAMRDAKLRLAYTIDGDQISMKVANVSLRSVWEVSLAVSGAQWPLVARVRVWPLVADAAPSERRLARLSHSAPDWGHVPRTIWRVFRYLKNKRSDDDDDDDLLMTALV